MAGANFTGTIDPATDQIIIGGLVLGKAGLAEDDAVMLSRDDNVTETTNGQNNSYGVAVKQNTRGTLTIRLLETAIENEALHALVGATTGSTGVVRVPWLIQRGVIGDGGYQLAGGFCWIESQPDIGFGATVGDREWVFKVDDASVNIARAATALPSLLA